MTENKELIPQDILERLHKNDEKAFEYIYWKYNSRVYNFANSLLYSEDIAENITQNVFIKIWEKRHEINPCQNFNAYLFTIARHLVYKETERRLRSELYVDEYDNTALDLSTEQSIDYLFTKEYYLSLIDKLPPVRRKIFKLSRFDKLSNKEIAARLSISEKTVETQIYRSTCFLKKKLLSDEGIGVFILLLISQNN